MRTHREIIREGGGPAAVGRAVGADSNLVKQWGRSDSIPAPYWTALVEAELASLEELAEGAAQRRRASNLPDEAAA